MGDGPEGPPVPRGGPDSCFAQGPERAGGVRMLRTGCGGAEGRAGPPGCAGARRPGGLGRGVVSQSHWQKTTAQRASIERGPQAPCPPESNTCVPGSPVPGSSGAELGWKRACRAGAPWDSAPPPRWLRQGGARAPSAGRTAEDRHWRARRGQPLRRRRKPAPWGHVEPGWCYP